MFKVDKYLDDWKYSSDALAKELASFVSKKDGFRFVKSYPYYVEYGKESFFGTFKYKDDELVNIELFPINAYNPGYPSKMYEELRFDFCKSLLLGLYGKDLILHDNECIYISDKYTVKCEKIPKGKKQFEGGKIIIQMKNEKNK